MVCETGDNASTNNVTAKALKVLPFWSICHERNLEVNRRVCSNANRKSAVDSVQKAMYECKQWLRNKALLRNIAHLSSTPFDQTMSVWKVPNAEAFCGNKRLAN